MDQQDLLNTFFNTLETQGWIFYVPKPIWKARQQGLLPKVVYRTIPENPPEHFAKITALMPSTTNGSRKQASRYAETIPDPTFTDETQWAKLFRALRIQHPLRRYVIDREKHTLEISAVSVQLHTEDAFRHDEDGWKNCLDQLRTCGVKVHAGGTKHRSFKCSFWFVSRTIDRADIQQLKTNIQTRVRKANTGELLRVARTMHIVV